MRSSILSLSLLYTLDTMYTVCVSYPGLPMFFTYIAWDDLVRGTCRLYHDIVVYMHHVHVNHSSPGQVHLKLRAFDKYFPL